MESQQTLIDTFFIKIGITGKMVLILLATSLLLVVTMAAAMNWNFQKGFLDYLTEAELSQLDGTVEKLANAYRREGSWTFILGNHRVWSIFLPHKVEGEAIAREHPSAFASQTSRFTDARPLPRRQGAPFAPPPPPNDRSGLSTRLRLLDAQRNYLIGPPDTSGKAILRPVKLEGEVIGWLSLPPPVRHTDPMLSSRPGACIRYAQF